jgi:hypothetical protein
MEDREFSSGTFILPPKADHEYILNGLKLVTLKESNQVCGCPMTDVEANMVLTLYHGLDDSMRDRLMARTVPDMLAMTVRCQALSKHDRSWSMFESWVSDQAPLRVPLHRLEGR